MQEGCFHWCAIIFNWPLLIHDIRINTVYNIFHTMPWDSGNSTWCDSSELTWELSHQRNLNSRIVFIFLLQDFNSIFLWSQSHVVLLHSCWYIPFLSPYSDAKTTYLNYFEGDSLFQVMIINFNAKRTADQVSTFALFQSVIAIAIVYN